MKVIFGLALILFVHSASFAAFEGERPTKALDECSIELLSPKLIHTKSLRDRTELLTHYFNNCEKRLIKKTPGTKNSLFQLLKQRGSDYNYKKTRWFQSAFLPESIRTTNEGQLGLRPGNEKHPLVMIDCGLQCGLDSALMKRLIMMLFDESDFHVLALPSSSSKVYQTRNDIFAVGGVEEGRSFVKIADYLLNKSPWKNRINSVHVVGASLAGHAVFYSGLYESALTLNNIKSRQALCPVVDLPKSLRHIYRPGLIGKFLLTNFRSQFRALMNNHDLLDTVLNGRRKIRYEDAIMLSEKASTTYYINEGNLWFSTTPPFLGERIDSTESFRYYNRFQHFAHLNHQDVFIWSSENDPIVRSNANSMVLEDITQGSSSPYQFLNVSSGSHCLFDQSYGWRTTGDILRANILAQENQKGPKHLKQIILINNFDEGHKIKKIKWSLNSQEGRARLEIKRGRFKKKFSRWFNLKDLDLPFQGLNTNEAQMIIRRLNSRYKIKKSEGQLILSWR